MFERRNDENNNSNSVKTDDEMRMKIKIANDLVEHLTWHYEKESFLLLHGSIRAVWP